MLKHPGKEAAYYYAVLDQVISNIADKSRVAPSAASRTYWRKRGVSLSYGETSIEEWIELEIPSDEYEERKTLVPEAKLRDATEKIRAKLSEVESGKVAGVRYVKANKNWTATLTFCGMSAHLGAWQTRGEAVSGMVSGLRSLLDLIKDMYEPGK